MATRAIDFSDLGGKVVQAPPSNRTFDFSDLGGKVVQPAQGQVRNDVGNTVIVPKQGEGFADTMQRAAAYGKTVTPQEINTEVRTMPAKAATTLAAAPVMGAAGAAGLVGAGQAGAAAVPYVGAAAPYVAGVAKWSVNHPFVTAMGIHLARELGIPLPKILDVISRFTPEGQ